MSHSVSADVFERIRKILVRTSATSGCTEAETSAAFRKAAAIMAEHNLTMAEVTASAVTPETESFIEADIYETAQWSIEDQLAWSITTDYFFVKGFFTRNGNKKILVFFGTEANVITAQYVFNALLDAFDRLWRIYRIENRLDKSERRIYVTGVARGFTDKLRDERRAAAMQRDMMKGKSSGSTALALVNIAALTEARFREKHNGKPGKANFAPLGGSKSTLDAGIAAGRKLNLNRAISKSSGQKNLTAG